ncbi:hypothetical protein [Thermomonospora umbrina]|uniref:hypothetical protein n=1 Tax=Thermomonospora umbrina TaxID=111806 RepID=UPI0011C12EB4|nr:hypothetical protein [Thermomonospora umbrina]
MNELKPMEDLCRAVAPTRTEALDAGRTRLLAEIERSGRRGPARPTFARTAVACALTLTIAAGVTIAQNIEGDAPPDRVGVLPGAPVADARDVALRARAVAWTQPDTTLNPRQWIYTKTLIAEIDGGVLGPRTRYSTNEAWRTVEGTSPPAKDPRVTVGVSEPTGKVLLGLPADPDAALARLYTEVDRINTLVEHPPRTRRGRSPSVTASSAPRAGWRRSTWSRPSWSRTTCRPASRPPCTARWPGCPASPCCPTRPTPRDGTAWRCTS